MPHVKIFDYSFTKFILSFPFISLNFYLVHNFSHILFINKMFQDQQEDMSHDLEDMSHLILVMGQIRLGRV